MNYDNLIDDLRWWADHCDDRTQHGCQTGRILSAAATALSALQAENERLKKERNAAVEKGRLLPEKCCCIPTCGGKKVAIVLDVEAVKEASHD